MTIREHYLVLGTEVPVEMDSATYYLRINDGGYSAPLAVAKLTYSEMRQMEREVETYNEHITLMSEGKAPQICYGDPSYREQRYIARHQKHFEHHQRPTRRSLYERWDVSLSLVPEEEMDEDDGREPTYDADFFNSPYRDGCGYSLGFGMLPVTKKMYGVD